MEIEKIPLNILSSVRQRLGAYDKEDTIADERISKMTPRELVKKYYGWHVGHEEWVLEIIGAYEELKRLEEEE